MDRLELLKQELAKEKKERQESEDLLKQKVLNISDANKKLVELNQALEKECTYQTLKVQRIEDRYQGIFNKLELGLLETDQNRKITRVYRGFCEMTGYEQEELIGKNTIDVFVPQKFQAKAKEIVFSPDYDFSGILETTILKKDGTLLWILISRVPIYNYRGKLKGILSINYDITSRKKWKES